MTKWERLKQLVLLYSMEAEQELEEDLEGKGIQIEALESKIGTLQWILRWMDEMEAE